MTKVTTVVFFSLLGTFAGSTILMAITGGVEKSTASTVNAQVSAAEGIAVETTIAAVSNIRQIRENLVKVCKASLAMMNFRDVATFTGKMINAETAHVAWVRPDDGKRWQGRCTVVDDTHIRWAAFDAFGDGEQGRWRDEDSVIVNFIGNRMDINIIQPGQPSKKKSFSISDMS